MRKSIPRNRENIRFVTPMEKKIHKMISSMAMGETILYKCEKPLSKEENEELNYCIKLSAAYNNMETYCKWSKDKKVLHITAEI
jgi:hypothetical protein